MKWCLTSIWKFLLYRQFDVNTFVVRSKPSPLNCWSIHIIWVQHVYAAIYWNNLHNMHMFDQKEMYWNEFCEEKWGNWRRALHLSRDISTKLIPTFHYDSHNLVPVIEQGVCESIVPLRHLLLVIIQFLFLTVYGLTTMIGVANWWLCFKWKQ